MNRLCWLGNRGRLACLPREGELDEMRGQRNGLPTTMGKACWLLWRATMDTRVKKTARETSANGFDVSPTTGLIASGSELRRRSTSRGNWAAIQKFCVRVVAAPCPLDYAVGERMSV